MSNDFIQGFLFDNQAIRGGITHLTQTVNTILAQHSYPAPVAKLVTEAVLTTSLLAQVMKFSGRLTLQFQSQDYVSLLVVQCDHLHNMRAMARWNDALAPPTNQVALFGTGQLVITVEYDHAVKPYQSIIPVEHESLVEALEFYFEQSEQLATRFFLSIEPEQTMALMLQQLPGEVLPEVWEEISKQAKKITTSTKLAELFAPEKITLSEEKPVNFHCQCSIPRMERAILTLGKTEANAVLEEHPLIEVTCDFCGHAYGFSAREVEDIFSRKGGVNDAKL